ncbi:hypothetical protein MACJ_001711 [Theileria orientalis]|uniref:Uncharacterized protein n=1 Tax=Theileria orientalis TaxID=68886 RepID=A0A976QTY6_THEOR|nr:hypothetical protein MACJ_001711 [Theileria orientalis]
MELDIASKNLAHSSNFWANVPLDIFFSYDSNKITSIKDGDYFIWQSSSTTYAKYVWLYSDTERAQMIDYIVTSEPSTIIGALTGPSGTKRDLSFGSDSTTSTSLSGYALPDTKGSKPSDGHGLTKTYTTSTTTSEANASEGSTAVYTPSNPADTVVSVTNRMARPACYIDGSEDMGFLRIKMYRDGNRWIRISRTDFFHKLDKMYSILPKLTTEKGKSTIPSNMDKFLPRSKPKFFAIDLDGTFLSLNTKYFVKNLKAFEKARQAGYYPLICTGRSFGSSFDGFNDLIMEHTTYNGFPGVYNNGTVVFDHSGNIIHKTCFSRDYMKKLLAYIQEKGAEGEFLFYDLEHYYCLFDSAMITSKLFLFYNFFKPHQIEPHQLLDIEPVMIYFYKNEPNFGPFINGVDHISKVTIFQLFTEITPPNVSKSFGVKKLMDYYGLDSDGLFFVGDGENDIEIMDSLNNSFAVGDAPDFVKLHAKFILEDKHTEAAVANLLTRVYDL